MSVVPILHNQALEPELIAALSRAYRAACRALGLADRDDELNLIVARKLVDLAQTGMRDPTALYIATVKEFK